MGTTTFAVAYVCPPAPASSATSIPLTEEHVFYASTLDGTSFPEACPDVQPPSGAMGTLTGSVDASRISTAGVVEISAQNPQNLSTNLPQPVPSLNGDFSLSAPAGTDRVMVLAYAVALNGLGETTLVAASDFSNQAVPGALNGGATVVLGAADQTTTEPLTYQDVPPGYSAPTTLVGYQMGTAGVLSIAGAATSGYPVLPAGAVESGDSYFFWASASSSSNFTQRTLVRTTLGSDGPESIPFPSPWVYAGPTAAALPSFDISYGGFSGSTGVYDEVNVIWPANSSTAENIIAITATGSYLNGSTTMVVPDLSGLTGFLAPASSGTHIAWTAAIYRDSSSSPQSPSSSGTFTTVSNSGTYNVP
jgi:hypothetical protein